MRIVNQPVPGVTKAYNKQINENNKQSSVRGDSKQDELAMSDKARLFNIATRALSQLPPAEEKNLDQLKASVKSGTYEVNNAEVIEKIWQESILDKRI